MSAHNGCGDGDSCGCGSGGQQPPPEQNDSDKQLRQRMDGVKNKVLVMSGKGGVGKSTVAVNLAQALAKQGKKVGLLDVDVHGPTVPILMGMEGSHLVAGEDCIKPVEKLGVKVVSIAFLMQDQDAAVIWRGPLKMSAITQFLRDVDWGELDYLVIDSPPGTGDEPLSVAQLLPEAKALIVTTPQRVATADVRKSIKFCEQVNMPILGVVENMAGLTCPHCGELIHVFPEGHAARMTQEMGVTLLSALPLDPRISEAADQGRSAIVEGQTAVAKAMEGLAVKLIDLIGSDEKIKTEGESAGENAEETKDGLMRIAIPLAGGKLTMHFGHGDAFSMLDCDIENKKVVARKDLTPPTHAPGVLPKWVSEQGATLVLAGGMGSRAVAFFEQYGVKVITGCPADEPEKVAMAYMNETLVTGQNVCDH